MLCIMHRERIVSLLFPLHSRRSQANHYPQGNLTRTVHDPISTIASFRKNLVNDALVTLCDVSRPRERRKDSIPRALSTYCGRVPHVPLFMQNRCYTTSRDGDEEWDPSQLENSPATEFDVEETMEQSAPAQPSSVLEDGEGGGGEEAEEEGTGLEDVEHPSEDASSVTRTRDEERIVHPTTATSPTLYVPTPDPSSPASEAGKSSSSSSSSSSSTSPPTEHIDVPQIDLRPCEAPPSRFETFSGTKVYKWSTIAKYGRRLIGPMREWADEFKYRTGITLQWEPVAPERVLLREYPHRDSVDVDVYLFGSDRAVENSMGLLQEMVQQEPCYVRCAIYRGQGPTLEWLTLRRINHDTRPPDIPPISLKTPGKWTLLFETRKEAVLRTVFEETGIHLEESALTYTGLRQDGDVEYFWRVPVHYYVAQLPPEAEVLGPQTALNDYFTAWDARILMQSPDPIDRTWAATADPTTGCAWLATSKIDELQLPIRGEDYMRSRYLPAPHLIELRNALGWAL